MALSKPPMAITLTSQYRFDPCSANRNAFNEDEQATCWVTAAGCAHGHKRHIRCASAGSWPSQLHQHTKPTWKYQGALSSMNLVPEARMKPEGGLDGCTCCCCHWASAGVGTLCAAACGDC